MLRAEATRPAHSTAELVAKDKAHLLHSGLEPAPAPADGPLVLARGEGVYLWDTDGKRYIDAFAGLWNVNVGHGRQELAEAAADQIDEVAFVPTFFGLASPPAIELAARLAELFPGNLNHFQFTSGGAESNETALKIARYYWCLKGKPEKVKIISRKMGYHGIAMGALAATGIPTYHEGFGPGVPGFVHLTAPYAYRNGEGLTEDEFVAKLVAEELEETIAREGADTIAAMIGEPVQGAGGVVVPPDGYWPAIAEVLKKHDILLIVDEVICGFGRTGTMFGDAAVRGRARHRLASPRASPPATSRSAASASRDEIFDVIVGAGPDVHARLHLLRPPGRLRRRAAQICGSSRTKSCRRTPPARARSLLDRLAQLVDHPHVGNVRGKGLMLSSRSSPTRRPRPASTPPPRLGRSCRAQPAVTAYWFAQAATGSSLRRRSSFRTVK